MTATSIKLGILLLNVGNVERLGVAVGVDPEQQERAWRAYIDEANQRGVAGRKIAPVFRQFDVTSNDSQRAACIAMTEDEKVFTVLDIALNAANALCVADEHDTPLITLQPMPADSYVRSEGRLVTLFSEGSRMWRNVAHDMHAQGLLKGRTIGILSNTAPGNPATMDAFTAELRALGYKVAYRGNLPSDGSAAQLPQASSRIPIEVRGMQTNNVDLIFLSTDTLTATQFVQQADGQRYHPKYYATDWQNAYSDTYVQNMPDSFDGTLITTNRTGEYRPPRPRPEPSTETSCRSIYEKRTGDTLERNTIEYNSTVRLCSILEVFTRGATAAGAGLTRRSLSEGTAAIGVLPLATFGGGSFRPGKQDAADLIRTARFNRACAGGSPNRCWLPVDDFRAPRYQ